MFERETMLYAFNLQMAGRLAADVDDAVLYQALPGGGNPPVWILGHLAISTDYALQILGREKQCPAEWHREFGPGSDPAGVTVRPTKAELLNALEAGHARVTAAIGEADLSRLAKPHRVEFIRDSPIQTNGDLLSHLLTTHAAMHLGQLSMWRRQMGHRPLF